MSIRVKITLWFTVVVSALLIISFWSINKRLENKNKSQFQQRLKNRTISTAKIWAISDTMVKDLMNNLDSGSIASLRNKYVAIYDKQYRILYQFADNPSDSSTPTASIFEKVKNKGELFFSEGARDAYMIRYTADSQPFYTVTIAFDEYRKNVSSNLKVILWIISTAGIILSLLSGWLFSDIILQPINRIVKDVNQLSSTNLSGRISVGNKKDELNALAETFNSLLKRLEDSFLIQRRFISNASHELSTPLTSMSSQLEVGLQQKRSSEEYEKIIKSVSDEVHVMMELTKCLLEIARAGSDGAIELTDVRIDEVLMNTVAHIKKTFPGYSINVQFSDLPENENECIVPGNSDLLYTAFKNIIENGCKYSEDNKINIDLSFVDKKIILDFVNKGDVLAEEDIEKIFQPFFRGSSAQGKPGFGLGLPLTKRIIKLHNGILSVFSHPAQGTRFHIELFSRAAS
ncbi:MAG: HAMP domain-containing protein [Bacteroidetes bacterium]|nr:HAMP domain-containing protein [Bacteroidota bacterium]MBS1929556.1 HAMP domain-containing protein [Bacteroidota bacterium]